MRARTGDVGNMGNKHADIWQDIYRDNNADIMREIIAAANAAVGKG